MKKEATKREIKGKELVWYIVAGVLAVLALTSLVFGIVGHYLPGSLEDNFINLSSFGEKKFLIKIKYIQYLK